jgi:hypothetical protein
MASRGLEAGPQHPSKDFPKFCVRFPIFLNRPNSKSRLTSTPQARFAAKPQGTQADMDPAFNSDLVKLPQLPMRRTRFVTLKIPPCISHPSPPGLLQYRRQSALLQLLFCRVHQLHSLLRIGSLQKFQTPTERTRGPGLRCSRPTDFSPVKSIIAVLPSRTSESGSQPRRTATEPGRSQHFRIDDTRHSRTHGLKWGKAAGLNFSLPRPHNTTSPGGPDRDLCCEWPRLCLTDDVRQRIP